MALDHRYSSSRNGKFVILLVLLCVFSSKFAIVSSESSTSNSADDFLGPECLKVAKSEFTSSIRDVVDIIRQVTSMLSQFSGFFGDFRLSNAVSDCLDLLDNSAEELSWTESATQNPKSKYVYINYN